MYDDYARTSGTYCSSGPRWLMASSTRTRWALTVNIACGFHPWYRQICGGTKHAMVRTCFGQILQCA